MYAGAVLVASGTCEGALLRTGEPIDAHPLLIATLMWTPALASILARLVLREGFRDVSFRARGPGVGRMLVAGWLLPPAVGLLAYGLSWAAGLAELAAPASVLGITRGGTVLKLVASLGAHLTLGALLGAILTAGEEIGWRGYMLTRLIDSGVPRPVLLSGLIWAAWHLPLVLSGQYASSNYPALSALCFALQVVGGAYVAARVRLESGSIWPAVVYHASWNAVIQGTFDRFTAGADASGGGSIWTGESGFVVVAVNLAVAIAFVARPWPVRRTPAEPATMTMGLRSA